MLEKLRRPISSECRDKLEFLIESQYWPLEKCLSFQWKKLKNLVAYAYANVPYYQTLFKSLGITPGDIQTPADFSKLPILKKKDIQDSFEEMISQKIDIKGMSVNSTGGSTGMPLNFYQSKEYEIWADASRIRAWKYFQGFDENTLESVLWGAIQDVGKGFSYYQVLYNVIREGILPLNTFELDPLIIKKYLKIFNTLRPKLLRGYASSLYYIARFIEENSLRIHKPEAIVSSTELLHARMREKIEAVFNCKVYDSYGCREVSQIGTECSEHDGFHIVFENQYVELIDNEIIVTNLNNCLMPFIRYAVGDLASEINYKPCKCGRFSPRISRLIGRDNDNIELPSGKIINGEFFEFLFFGMPEVIQYQITFSRSKGEMIVKFHLKEKTGYAEKKVRQIMKEKYNFDNLQFVYTDSFDKTPTGKLRFVYMED